MDGKSTRSKGVLESTNEATVVELGYFIYY